MSLLKIAFIVCVAAVATAISVSNNTLEVSCTVSAYNDVAAAVQSCSNLIIKDLTVPAKTTLLLNLKNGASLTFLGTISWQYAEWAGPLIVIKGNKVSVNGNGATLDGKGGQWWDGKGDKGKVKPKFLTVQTTGQSNVKNIKLLNCPKQCVSINSASDTTLENFNVDVSAGDSLGGHNTDGFDISSSSRITVKDSVVKNQDDCVAVNQGYDMIFQNLTCSGGHGLSLSVGQSSQNGSPNVVSNVTFVDCIVTNSDNGIHIKTHSDGGTGYIRDVTYKNIQLSGINKYGVNIEEDYENGSPTGKPYGNIPITNLKLTSVTGSMTGSSNCMGVYILCGSNGCNNWPWSDVSISNAKESSNCNFYPSGFSCK